MSHPRISVFAGTADGNAQVVRVLGGQATLQARTNHQFAFDPVHDELIIPNPFAQAILFFRGVADGEEAPIRVIQGPKTLLGYTDNITVDPIHNEVLVSQFRSNAVLVFRRDVGGDQAPIRIIHGPKTRIDRPIRIAVDPVNNIIALTTIQGLWMFDRTANGDVPPKWVIAGPKTGLRGERVTQVALSPEGKKVLIGGQHFDKNGNLLRAYVGVWKYGDNGDIGPWAVIPASKTTTLERSGSAFLNPQEKELITIASGRILFFHMPELFEP